MENKYFKKKGVNLFLKGFTVVLKKTNLNFEKKQFLIFQKFFGNMEVPKNLWSNRSYLF